MWTFCGARLAFQQLRRAPQAAERIFDLVRQLPDHEAAAIEPRQQVVFARDALALSRVRQLQQKMGAGDLSGQRRDSYIQDTGVTRSPERPDNQLAVGDSLTGFECPAQNAAQTVRVLQKVAEGAAPRLVQAECEQILRGDIRVDGAELRIQHDNTGRQRIEQVGWIEMGECGR
jgi:hypothetical protein